MAWPDTPTIEPSPARWVPQSEVREGRGRFRPDEPHAIVAMAAETCPMCAAPIEADVARQDALLRHGGYGATRRTTRLRCPSCAWTTGAQVDEERPPRDTGGAGSKGGPGAGGSDDR